jgi:predicted RNase H-like nuclease (RuvC/YqgF family)
MTDHQSFDETNNNNNGGGIGLAIKLGKIFEESGLDIEDWKLQKLHADILEAILLSADEDLFTTTENEIVDDGFSVVSRKTGQHSQRPFSSPVYRKKRISDEINESPSQQQQEIATNNNNDLVSQQQPSFKLKPVANNNNNNNNNLSAQFSMTTSSLPSGASSPNKNQKQDPQHHSSSLNTLPDPSLSTDGIETHNLLLRNLLHQQAKKFQAERLQLMRENAILRTQIQTVSHNVGHASTPVISATTISFPSSSSTINNNNDDTMKELEQAVVNSENLVKEVERHRERTHEFKHKLGSEAKRRSHEVGELSRRLAEVQKARTAERDDLKNRLADATKYIEASARREHNLGRENTRLKDEVDKLHSNIEKHKVVSQALESQLARAPTSNSLSIKSKSFLSSKKPVHILVNLKRNVVNSLEEVWT